MQIALIVNPYATRVTEERVRAIERRLGVPVRFAGVGERPEDLVDFDPAAFVAALFEATT